MDFWSHEVFTREHKPLELDWSDTRREAVARLVRKLDVWIDGPEEKWDDWPPDQQYIRGDAWGYDWARKLDDAAFLVRILDEDGAELVAEPTFGEVGVRFSGSVLRAYTAGQVSHNLYWLLRTPAGRTAAWILCAPTDWIEEVERVGTLDFGCEHFVGPLYATDDRFLCPECHEVPAGALPAAHRPGGCDADEAPETQGAPQPA